MTKDFTTTSPLGRRFSFLFRVFLLLALSSAFEQLRASDPYLTNLHFFLLGSFVFAAALLTELIGKKTSRAGEVVLRKFWFGIVIVIVSAHLASIVGDRFWGGRATLWLFLSDFWYRLRFWSVSYLFVYLAILFGVSLLSWLLFRIIFFRFSFDRRASRLLLIEVSPLLLLTGLSLAMVCTRESYDFYKEPISAFFGFPRSLDIWTEERIEAARVDAVTLANFNPFTPADRPNIVVILSDALRADHLPFYGYSRNTAPFLNSLIEEDKASFVKHATSPCSETFCGIVAVLSSYQHQKASKLSLKFTQLLNKIGYSAELFLIGRHRGWPYLWDYLTDVSNVHDFWNSESKFEVEDDRNALHWLDQWQPKPPFALFFHLMSTHVAGTEFLKPKIFGPEPQINLAFMWNSRDSFSTLLTDDQLNRIRNQYDNRILQADYVIKEIISKIERVAPNNTIFIILADHGESLGERGQLGHSHFLYEKDIQIPLVWYDTSGEKLVNQQNGSLYDIAPTLFDRLKIPAPDTWLGKSLRVPAQPRKTFHQTRRANEPCRAVESWNEISFIKIQQCLLEGVERTEAFDLRADPKELKPISLADPSAQALIHELEAKIPWSEFRDCGSGECQ